MTDAQMQLATAEATIRALIVVCDGLENAEGMLRRDVDKRIERLRSLAALQCSPGNWDYDPYQLGLANGLLLALAVVADGEYQPLTPPPVWGRDRVGFIRRTWRKLRGR